jgi:hypothetical protein
MRKVKLGFSLYDFDNFKEKVDKIFNDDYFKSISKYEHMKLTDIDENLYLPALEYLDEDITWEDIENNEELYKLLEKVVNLAGYSALQKKVFEMALDLYLNEFDNNIIKFLNDKNNEFYGYITIDDAYTWVDLSRDFDRIYSVNIYYSYEDEDVMEFFGDEGGYTNIEKARKEFEDIINELIFDKLQELDDYIGSKIDNMIGREKFRLDINKEPDYSYFKKEFEFFLYGGFYWDEIQWIFFKKKLDRKEKMRNSGI